MKLGINGEAMIKYFEGFGKEHDNGSVHAYPDPATGGKPWSIGWGSTGPDIGSGTVWTKAQCQARFDSQAAGFVDQLNKLLGAHPTTQNQFDAMLCLFYNIGPGKFAKSSVLRFHLAGDYGDAARAFFAWNKAAGKVMNGLVIRRTAEAKLYGTA